MAASIVTFTTRIVPGLVLIMLLSATAVAQDFRIDTEIFGKDEKKPVSQNKTLFANGVVYDFLLGDPLVNETREITIFDPAHEEFVLLDVARRVRLTLTKKQLVEINAAMRQLGEEKDPGLFDTNFEVTFDDQEQWLTLANKRIEYRARGASPDNPEAIAVYRHFADWYARLNATRPGSIPPFARLELNEAIAQRGFIPAEVRLEISPKQRLFGKTFEASSRHSTIWQISRTDRTSIEKANRYRASFEEVSFEEYRQLAAAASDDR